MARKNGSGRKAAKKAEKRLNAAKTTTFSESSTSEKLPSTAEHSAAAEGSTSAEHAAASVSQQQLGNKWRRP